MRRRHAVLSAFIAVIALTFISPPFVRSTEGQALQGEYKIGLLEPLTGPLAFEGKRHLDGYEVMRDLINAQGGVMGKKLVFVVGDATDPTAAASEANRLITREGVKIITGTYSSTLCGAASEAASRQNVIYWESSCVDPRFNKRGLKNVFRTEIDATGFGWYNVEFIAKHLAPRFNLKPNQIKVAFLAEDSSYGQGVTEAARLRAKNDFGMQEVALEYYAYASTNDFSPIIAKFKQLNPDVVHHIARSSDAVLFWRQSKEQNFQFKALVHAGATGYGSIDFGKALGADGNGPFVLAEPGPGLRLESFRPEARKLEQDFSEAIKKRTGDEPLASHRLAGSGLWVLKVVLDQSKTDELEKFRATVLALDMPVGSMLNGWGVKFAENGQNANERVQHYMLQWQQGRMMTVWPEEFTTGRAKWIPLGAWDQRK
ncbi:MAG: ABC transporter substrate-binding protein [Candidatus Rokubacteria bacterium]|nr:ABC transporter substrate-binding protein [Candidatus Rokubacteria bacterium]